MVEENRGENRKAISKAVQLAVFRRDRWLCHWCKRPVIFAPAIRLLELQAKQISHEEVAYYHRYWTRRDSPLLDGLGACLDHVIAHSAGGDLADGNLCTACSKCNVTKSNSNLEVWDARHKRKPVKGCTESLSIGMGSQISS
ncbi:MAG: hypothetical protein C4320_01155 [Armatimonadota bacterium]